MTPELGLSKNGNNLESILSTFYASVLCTKFWHLKLQSCVLGLKFFGAKISATNVDEIDT